MCRLLIALFLIFLSPRLLSWSSYAQLYINRWKITSIKTIKYLFPPKNSKRLKSTKLIVSYILYYTKIYIIRTFSYIGGSTCQLIVSGIFCFKCVWVSYTEMVGVGYESHVMVWRACESVIEIEGRYAEEVCFCKNDSGNRGELCKDLEITKFSQIKAALSL